MARRQINPGETQAPPNKGMELTTESVTPLAFARGVTLSFAAHPQRYVDLK